VGGAHTNPTAAATLLDVALARALNEVSRLAPAERVEARYQKFRGMGRLGEDFAEETQGSA
jgi:acetyl-CoA carboxylase alpha subunit